MIVENKQYIAEIDFKSIGKGLAKGALIGTGLFGSMVTGAKALGIGRFAPPPQETIVQSDVPTQTTTSQIQQQPPVNNQQVNNTQQKVVQNAPQKINQKEKEFDYGSEHAKKLYGAIVSAEHRGVVGDDPYTYNPKIHVRNKVLTNSSAFGPGQLTSSSVKAFVDKGKIKNSKFVKSFLEQGKKLLSHGKKHPTYGFGGIGDLGGEEHADSHKQLTVDFMKAKGEELGIDIHKPLSKNDLYRFTKHWNVGIGSKEEPKKWYVDTIHNFYYGK